VAKADSTLFNKASQVVLVHDDDKTVITMANDFQGNLREFAVVIPVPTFIERGQIHVTEKKFLDHLDAYTAPRLVEYFDNNPCQRAVLYEAMPSASLAGKAEARRSKDQSYGVTVEAEYTVGEYDIVILSAKESSGLEAWLIDNGYRIPTGAREILGSYLKQQMRFFVAKVNLQEQAKLGFSYLRPIQVAYESPKFMLPIRLGTVNSQGTQELFIYTLSRKGRVETTNYRTVRLPSNMDLPIFIKNEFADFYRAMFERQVQKEKMEAVFLEYAWDMNWCDPCAADPLSKQELRELGIFWLEGNESPSFQPAQDVFVTRLHVRYDADHFPEDLVFQETGSRENFQGRYVLRHPWTGNDHCDAADEYRSNLRTRQEQEAQTLSQLTGWNINQIYSKMNFTRGIAPTSKGNSWWDRLWND
jgi:hypothetical protein